MSESKNRIPPERRSARLRHTLEIARLAGLDYDANTIKKQWGGFFNIYQLERIEAKLRELDSAEKEIEALRREIALLKGGKKA